jgi:hypothetical protein
MSVDPRDTTWQKGGENCEIRNAKLAFASVITAINTSGVVSQGLEHSDKAVESVGPRGGSRQNVEWREFHGLQQPHYKDVMGAASSAHVKKVPCPRHEGILGNYRYNSTHP